MVIPASKRFNGKKNSFLRNRISNSQMYTYLFDKIIIVVLLQKSDTIMFKKSKNPFPKLIQKQTFVVGPVLIILM